MKKLLWFLAVFAAVCLMFTGCPTESDDGDPPPPTELGDIDLRLAGAIYEVTETSHPEYNYPVYSYPKTIKGGEVSTTVNGQSVTVAINNGAFDITIPKPTSPSLTVLSLNIPTDLSDNWNDITVSDTAAEAMIITELQTDGEIGTNGVWKGKYQVGNPNFTTMSITMTSETVGYIYVDRETIISASENKWTDTDSSNWTAREFSLKLAQGWNVLYLKITAVMYQANPSNMTVELSKNNPGHLVWSYEN
jgi:hypothetical protein